MKGILTAIALGLLDNAVDFAKEHTVRRFRNALLVATYPLVTPRADSTNLWKSCLRVAWRGATSRHPDALEYFVMMRRRIEESRRFVHGAARSGFAPPHVEGLRDEHLEAVTPLPGRPRVRA